MVNEDNPAGRFGGELAAVVADQAFEFLEAPLQCVTAPDTPVPDVPPLERFYLSGEEDVAETAAALLED